MSASLLVDFNIGRDNLATANNSFDVLYKPTVVIYDLGSVLNEGTANVPSVEVKYVGF